MIDVINVSDLKEKMEANKDLILIDCREENEWNELNIPGASLMPLSQFEVMAEDMTTAHETPIYIHCRSGKRSLKACQILQGEGFENLYNVEGGILAWAEAGFKTSSSK